MDNLGFEFQLGQDIYVSKMSRLASGTNQPAIQWVLGDLSWERSGQNMRLATHLHKVTGLRKSGAILTWHVQRQLHICFFTFTYENLNTMFMIIQKAVIT